MKMNGNFLLNNRLESTYSSDLCSLERKTTTLFTVVSSSLLAIAVAHGRRMRETVHVLS